MWFLVLGITGLSVLGWLTNTVPPDSFWIVTAFYAIVAGTTFCLAFFILKITRRAVLVTLGIVLWLVLRMLGLRDWYYPALLVPILISLEILLKTR